MENEVLNLQKYESPAATRARRAAERALEPRYAAYLEEVQRLVAAGTAELRERGTAEPRVVDIVRRAGLSNQAFYRHFRSKDELLVAILEEGTRLLLSYLDFRMRSAPSPLGRVRAWLEGVLAQALRPRGAEATRPFVINRSRLLERLPADVAASAERLKAPLRSAIAEACEAGELPGASPQPDADAVYLLAVGWLHEALSRPGVPAERDARHLVDFALRALGAAPARALDAAASGGRESPAERLHGA